MNIDDLCAAVKSSLPILKGARIGKKIDHTLVEQFQESVKNKLNANNNGYKWDTEITPQGRSEKDSIDILGMARKHKKDNPIWIIEIDATRSDQVSQKYLSRLALWGLKEPINYVALLYPDTQNGKNSCEKYLRYGSEVLREINRKSNLTGIIVDLTNEETIEETIEVQQYIANGKKGSDHFELKWKDNKVESRKECKSMSDTAKEAIKLYLRKNTVSFTQLKDYWGKFVEDHIVSKAKNIRVKTIDGVTVHTYTQFRQYGICAYWPDFVKLCRKKKMFITKMRKIYIGGPSPYIYKI